MNSPRQISHSPIYREFRAIEGTDWRTVKRFYEEYETEISQLAFDEYFEIFLAYTNSLFEIGLYEKHIPMADRIIEISIENNIKFHHGTDVFVNNLFRKAASLYHTYELEKSEYILREILRIDPHCEEAILLLKKCLRKMRPLLARRTRAVSMFFFLLSAAVICLEMLVVRTFYKSHIYTVEIIRTGIFALGLLTLIGGELLHRWRCVREVDGFVEVLRRRK